MRGKTLVASAVLIAALTGCGSGTATQAADSGPGASTPSPVPGDAGGPREQVTPDLPLQGTRWEVTHATQGPPQGAPADPDAAVSAGVAPAGAFLVIDEGEFSGSDGCNFFSGSTRIDGAIIRFDPSGLTYMACPGIPGADAVLAVLDGAVAWRIDVDVLHLEHPSGAGLQMAAETATAAAAIAGGEKCRTHKECRVLDLADDECVRDGLIIEIPAGLAAISGGGVSDYGPEAVGKPTPEAALQADRFSREKPRHAFRYEVHRVGNDKAVGQRLIGDRVVATASLFRTPSGGWLFGGFAERAC